MNTENNDVHVDNQDVTTNRDAAPDTGSAFTHDSGAVYTDTTYSAAVKDGTTQPSGTAESASPSATQYSASGADSDPVLGNSSMNAGSSGTNYANTGSEYTYNAGTYGNASGSYTGTGAGESTGYMESQLNDGLRYDDGFGVYEETTSSKTDMHTNDSYAYSAGGDSAFSNTGGDSAGGHNGGDTGGSSTPTPKKSGNALYLTKRSLIAILIVCMLLTSGLTFGGLMLYNNHIYGGSNTATNYKLSKSTETLSYKSIIQKTQDSVVSIRTSSISTDSWAQNYVTQGAGSGVIIQTNGYILTCNHVIDGATKIKVTLRNKKTYTAKVVGADSDNDIAVLKINATGLTAATYGDSSKLAVGDHVVAIGNPLGELSNTATTGIISALNRDLTIDGEKMNLLQTDASINPGNSGGALFNSSGNLIGIVVAKSTGSDVEGLGFAIPINRAAKIAKNLIKTGKGASNSTNTSSPKIGVTIVELSDEEAQQNGLTSGGVYVSEVTASRAKRAGFKSGDRIYSADGTVITDSDSLMSVLKKHKSGDKIKVIVERDGRSVSLTAPLK